MESVLTFFLVLAVLLWIATLAEMKDAQKHNRMLSQDILRCRWVIEQQQRVLGDMVNREALHVGRRLVECGDPSRN